MIEVDFDISVLVYPHVISVYAVNLLINIKQLNNTLSYL